MDRGQEVRLPLNPGATGVRTVGNGAVPEPPIVSATNPIRVAGAEGADTRPKSVPVKSVPVKSVPVKMTMPSEKRPVWRGGVIQIWITRACDRMCYGCTQASNLGGKAEFIAVDQFRAAVETLKDYWGVVGIFGGNPVLHPQFDKICGILRDAVPWEQRGLWCNHPKSKGAIAAATFNPAVSNLNVHQSQEAWEAFASSWPESKPYLKGLTSDSRHSPPWVAMKDVIPDEEERWRLIDNCDINRYWSAMIGVFRKELRAWFCEIAGSQAMLHQHELDYPDTGLPVASGWWKRPHADFEIQIRKHCHECGIPLKGYGALANSGPAEQVSETHKAVFAPRERDRKVELVVLREQLKEGNLPRVTDYIENSAVSAESPNSQG